MSADVCVLLITAPADERAAAIARTLVEEGLAACVNVLPGVTSIYRWQGKVEADGETLLVVKTTAAQIKPIQGRLVAIHPYELPELIALPVSGGSEGYLGWVRGQVGA